MVPQHLVEQQTADIVLCLLGDEGELRDRGFDAGLEVDSVASQPDDDDFDPVVIADRLRRVADSLNDDPRFRAALTDLKQAVANEAAEKAFSHSVEVLCQHHVAQRAEVAPEMQIIKAAVALGLYVKNSCPELRSRVQGAMQAFLNRRVGGWVAQQGGWAKVVEH